MKTAPLVNRVANSGLITINLEDWFPKRELHEFDLTEYLFQGLILREKEFRVALREHEWSKYERGVVLVYCSSDAIIPMWAYMLISTYVSDAGAEVFVGSREAFLNHHYKKTISEMDTQAYVDQRVVIKGCSDAPVPPGAYAYLSARLQPLVKKIMFGEPCSTVPIWKK
ncbi:MAG: DUF2480 family protein [Bacteroidota bacterium]